MPTRRVSARVPKNPPAGAIYLSIQWSRSERGTACPMRSRQRAMDEQIRIGHEFPRVKINTSYSFGLDDQEFVVAFETDYPGDFLDLVEKLRGGEASAFTEREAPIFTCVAGSIADVVELLG